MELPKPDQDNLPENFEPTGIDFDAKYPGRQKLTLTVNASSVEDQPFIVKDTSAATANLKYTDLSNEIIYRFDLSEYKDAVIVATVCQNYLVQVSKDGTSWTTIQDYALVSGGRIEGDSNETTVGAAAEKYANGSNYIYLRFANADTSTGWGTGLSKIEIYYLK